MEEFKIAAIARPGDTILIGFSRGLSDEDIDALDRDFRPLVDSGIKVGFMDHVNAIVVVRPDEDDEDAPELTSEIVDEEFRDDE